MRWQGGVGGGSCPNLILTIVNIVFFAVMLLGDLTIKEESTYEPPHEKTNNLHM